MSPEEVIASIANCEPAVLQRLAQAREFYLAAVEEGNPETIAFFKRDVEVAQRDLALIHNTLLELSH
jgi:hypothetical protein